MPRNTLHFSSLGQSVRTISISLTNRFKACMMSLGLTANKRNCSTKAVLVKQNNLSTPLKQLANGSYLAWG